MNKTDKKIMVPRLSVYRSNMHIYAQVIDDSANKTIAAGRDVSNDKGMTKKDRARDLGLRLAGELSKIKIKRVVFDRGRYKYLGRIKVLVEAVREGGITI